MGLTLHVGARSSGVDRLLTERWREDGGLLVARDEHSLGQALSAATADGAVWGCRAGTFATLFGRARELAGLADAERRDGLALRCAITEALDPPGAGHVAALERLILELRGARASPAAFTAAAEATGSPPLRTAARVYQAVADIPSPDAPEWETVDAAASVEIGPLYLVGFDDYAPGRVGAPARAGCAESDRGGVGVRARPRRLRRPARPGGGVDGRRRSDQLASAADANWRDRQPRAAPLRAGIARSGRRRRVVGGGGHRCLPPHGGRAGGRGAAGRDAARPDRGRRAAALRAPERPALGARGSRRRLPPSRAPPICGVAARAGARVALRVRARRGRPGVDRPAGGVAAQPLLRRRSRRGRHRSRPICGVAHPSRAGS